MQMVVFGDYMVFGKSAEAVLAGSAGELAASLKALIGPADVAICNLEMFVCAPGHEPRSRCHAPAESIAILKEAGFHAVSVSNNHAWDEGEEAIRHTLGLLDDAGIQYFGMGDERGGEPGPVVLVRGGVRLGLLAYTSSTVVAGLPRFRIAAPSVRRLRRDVKALRPRCDVLLVSLHCGTFGTHPSPEHRAWCAAAIEAGADGVVTHHNHMIGGIEGTPEKVVAYGLGNLVCPFSGPRCCEDLLVRLEVGRAGLTGWAYEPFFTDDRGFPVCGAEERRAAVREKVERINRDLRRPDYDAFYWSTLPGGLLGQFMRSWRSDFREYGVRAMWAKVRHLRWHQVRMLLHALFHPKKT